MSEEPQKAGDSYDYSTRSGVRAISWNDFHGLVKALVRAVAPWKPTIILPIGRGGYYPGTLMAHMLQTELYLARLSRRERDVVVRATPQWLVPPPAGVAGHRVLVVDEISSTGETLSLARARLLAMDVAEVRTAVLYAHTWGAGAADYVALITDELVLNPWDREVYLEEEFILHPEYAQALNEQGLEPQSEMLIATPYYVTEKIPNP